MKRWLCLLVLTLFLIPSAAAQSREQGYYEHRGLCGLAAVGIHLFGYAEVVEIGSAFAPRGEVVAFIAWCGSRGVGGDDNPSEGPEKRECTFSTDCPKSCSGSSIVQNDCVNYKCVPPPRTVEQCSVQVSSAAGHSFPYICAGTSPGSACAKDSAAIQAKIDALQEEYNDVNAQRQEATNLFLEANKICLNGLADVTNKLIIDTALMLKKVPTKLMSLITSNTAKLIDKISQKVVGGQPTDTQNEFYLEMCVLNNNLKDTELPLLDKKAENLLGEVRALTALL